MYVRLLSDLVCCRYTWFAKRPNCTRVIYFTIFFIIDLILKKFLVGNVTIYLHFPISIDLLVTANYHDNQLLYS